MTRRDLRCEHCGHLFEWRGSIHQQELPPCPLCHGPVSSYFGRMAGTSIPINFGFRPQRYASSTDRDIAQFQFTNL